MAQTVLHTLATIQVGYNMNIEDKLEIIRLRISIVEEKINVHNRVLFEDYNSFQEGDEEVVRNSLADWHRVLDALNSLVESLTIS